MNEERLKTIVIEEAYRTIKINEADRQISVPMAQAVVRSLAVNAVKGNQRAQRVFTELLTSVESANKKLYDEWFATAVEYKIQWERELERRKTYGIDAPEPVPHPDHLVLDMNRGLVLIKGPVTKEDKIRCDKLRERKAECDRTIEAIGSLLKRCRSEPRRNALMNELAQEKRLRERIEMVVPD